MTRRAQLLQGCCGSGALDRADDGPSSVRRAATRRLRPRATTGSRSIPKTGIEAFDHHPRIGDRDSLRRKFAATRALSEREQSGVGGASEDVLAALLDGNRAYEARFGYIFIVCATGKSAEEMLALLEARLQNDPAIEIRIAAEEHAKICDLRLRSPAL